MIDTFEIPDGLLARCVGRVDLVQRVLTAFVEQMNSDIPAMSDAANSGDAEETRKLAHRIKGASANVEAESIRSGAAEVEAIASENQLDDAKPLIAKMKTNWQEYLVLTSSFLSE